MEKNIKRQWSDFGTNGFFPEILKVKISSNLTGCEAQLAVISKQKM